jgi:hypothetical protein
MKRKIFTIIFSAFFVFLLSACRDETADRPGSVAETSESQVAAAQTTGEKPSAPEGASERAASKLAVPETVVEGIVLPEYYEFDYPEEFRTFMDSCIEYSVNEDAKAIANICGYGGSNQDEVSSIRQCCLNGIGMYQYSLTYVPGIGGDTARKLWHYSFWYEGYRCVLYFVDGEGAKYEWIEFWLIPDNGKGYVVSFCPGNKYHSDKENFCVMNCTNGLFEGEFVTKTLYSDDDEVFVTTGTVKHGLLDGICSSESESRRYENGRLMEYWTNDDPSRVTNADDYYLNQPDMFFTAGPRRCRCEKSDRGMIWDPF